MYIPESLWPEIKREMESQLGEIKMGPVEDFTNFINAVIDQASFDLLTRHIDDVDKSPDAEILFGGSYDDSEGYFIEPTVIQVTDPGYVTMREELFGPILSVYVYRDAEWSETLDLVDSTSPYALTGAIFAYDRKAVIEASRRLDEAAGNFYINDKPTGAVVGQQPFGGARASGTNDKAGSILNLVRWISARSIKETFSPPRHFSYPFLEPDAN